MYPVRCYGQLISCVIAGFRHDVDDICVLLGYYVEYSCTSLPSFRDDIEDGTGRLSRNIGNEMLLYAA
jgi:hypothetical protein